MLCSPVLPRETTCCRDGSSCTEMAASLRALLKMDFNSAAGVHINQQTGEDFKRNIDCNWNWLDGGSLL